MKKMLIILFISIISLSGCMTMYQKATEDDKIAFFNISYDESFDVIKRILFKTNCEIMDANREAGFIIGRYKHKSELFTLLMLGEAQVIYTYYKFLFFKKSNGVEITANIYTAYADGSHASQALKEGYLKFWEEVRTNF